MDYDYKQVIIKTLLLKFALNQEVPLFELKSFEYINCASTSVK